MGDYMYDKKKILIFSIIAMLGLGSAIFIHILNTNSKGITAMEGKSAADEIALRWNSSAIFVGMGNCGQIDEEGKCTCWIYQYQNKMDGNGTYRLNIKIYYNRENKTEILWLNAPTSTARIKNWTIDSDEAYSIAMKNEKIKAYMDRYANAGVDIFSLTGSQSGNPVWEIAWVDWGFMDDPHWAKIQIDATTGEVLYVEADLSDGSSYLICLVPLVIIISILLVILLSKSKRFTTFAATGFALFLLPALFLHIYYYSAIFTFMALVFGAVLWKGLEKYMGRDFLKSGDKKVVYGLFGLLAADYFCLIIARFLSISYSYPDLLWSSFIIINVAVLYMILSLTFEKDDSEGMLKPFKN